MARHYSMSPYCAKCRLRAAVCLCAAAPRLNLPTRLVIVMHAIEWGRASNTGHLARLLLANAEIRIHGQQNRPVTAAGIDTASAATFVLFPGRGDTPLTAALAASLGQPATLIVPDGNWHQARTMMTRLPMLRHARSVHLDTPPLPIAGLRHNTSAAGRSTFEAIAQALGVLEGVAVESQLLDFFREYRQRKRGHDCHFNNPTIDG